MAKAVLRYSHGTKTGKNTMPFCCRLGPPPPLPNLLPPAVQRDGRVGERERGGIVAVSAELAGGGGLGRTQKGDNKERASSITIFPLLGTAVHLVLSVEYGVKKKFAIITATGIYTDEGTDTVVLSVYMYFVVEFLDEVFRVIPQNFRQRNVRKEFHSDENPHNSTVHIF
jgi:hypothetical protein